MRRPELNVHVHRGATWGVRFAMMSAVVAASVAESWTSIVPARTTGSPSTVTSPVAAQLGDTRNR